MFWKPCSVFAACVSFHSIIVPRFEKRKRRAEQKDGSFEGFMDSHSQKSMTFSYNMILIFMSTHERLPETTSAVFRRPWKVPRFGARLTFQVHAVSGPQHHLIMSAVATFHVLSSRQIRALIYICKY
jgi:hypothetical protein